MIRLCLVWSLLVLMSACGDDDGSDAGGLPDTGATADSGPVVDANTADDAGAVDATEPLVDGGSTADGGPAVNDAGSDAGTDAATPDAGASVCDGIEIGNRCEGSRECTGGTHECVGGMCRPTGRLGCTSPEMNCASRSTPTCVLPAGSRTGICLTMEEALCVCTELSDAYNCGS